MSTDLLLSLANFFYLLGTIFMIKRLFKNRKSLNDFDFYGSMINFIGMVVTAYAFIEIKSYIAAIISIPTMLFWAMAALYSFKNRGNK
jgi:hypothetical protein